LATVPRRERFEVFLACTLPFSHEAPNVESSANALPPELFVGREEELRRLRSTDPDSAFLVYGGRQFGKTSLLKRVQAEMDAQADRGHKAVWLDMRTEQAQDLTPRLVRALRGSVLTQRQAVTTTLDVVLGHIGDWLDAEQGRRLLVLVDEADDFFESDARDDYRVTGRLKEAMTHSSGRFKVVFAGLDNVQRMATRKNQPLLHLGRSICVGPLTGKDARAARDLVQRPLTAIGFDVPNEVATAVLSRTCHYPHLTQILCSHLARALQDRAQRRVDGEAYPPLLVTCQDVEDTWHTADVQAEFYDRLRRTLELDPRYDGLALTLAWMIHRGEVDFATGVTTADLLARAAEKHPLSPELFTRDDDERRAILDEMVGMGLLRPVNGTAPVSYTFRSRQVFTLLGRVEQVQQRLNESAARTRRPTAGRDQLHRLLSDATLAAPSPLRRSDEDELLWQPHGVGVVFGFEMAGLDQVQAGLSACLSQEVNVASYENHENAVARIQEFALSRSGRAVNVLVVPPECPWEPSWVLNAHERLGALTSPELPVRVVFVGDARRYWLWLQAESRPPADLPQVLLRPWSVTEVAEWLRQADVSGKLDDDDLRQAAEEVREVTGGWYEPLRGMAGPLNADLASYTAVCLEQINRPDAPPPQVELPDAVEQMLAAWPVGAGDLTVERLVSLAGLAPAIAERALLWASDLGLLRPAATAGFIQVDRLFSAALWPPGADG